MQAFRLKTEYLKNPIGIDITEPRFFWNCRGGQTQTAFQIEAIDDSNSLVWDSGKIASGSMHARYDGKKLESRSFVSWKVRLWDENDDVGEWSKPAFFEIGLLSAKDWESKWISGNYKPEKKKRFPVDCFEKNFSARGNIKKARLYITACGVYEAEINGRRAGSFILAPGFTSYDKRLYYQTYDVTSLVKGGENSISIMLANGWYRGSVGAMGITYVYGKQTKLFLQLEITYGDGSKTVISSNNDFLWSNDGPISFADLKDGEIVDSRRKPTLSGKAIIADCDIIPAASNNVPVTEHERFTPLLSKSSAKKTILDFGQNIAGYVEFTVNAKDGQKIFMQFAERLKDGELDMANIQCRADTPKATPKQEITYICKDGENHYKTRFAVFGFRFASIETDVEFKAEDFSAIAVYSDMEETGSFSCSNPLINRFFDNTKWSMKGNFLDVPTDCPTRERAPWTGDVQIFAKTSAYLMDTAAFYRKWLYDLADRQTAKGKIPCHAPDVRNNEYFAGLDFIKRMDGCCGWADVAVLLPWRLYEIYRDVTILENFYPMMKAHIKFQISRTNKTGFCAKPVFGEDKKYISNVGQAFGEWLEPPDVYKQSVLNDFLAPHSEEATAYLSFTCGIMAEIARLVGHDEDIPLYEEYNSGCKKAYNNRFVRGGEIDTDRQSKLVRPLAFNLLDGAVKTNVLNRLIESIIKREYKIGTGFLSTPLILPTLTKLGFLETAYKMMENEEAPGWLAEVKAGATTVWENWDGSASNNHYSPGSVCEWLVETVCGIKVIGENNFSIAPMPGGALTHAEFIYQSLYGTVSSKWTKKAEHIIYEITIPCGCTAFISLPSGKQKNLTAGNHTLIE